MALSPLQSTQVPKGIHGYRTWHMAGISHSCFAHDIVFTFITKDATGALTSRMASNDGAALGLLNHSFMTTLQLLALLSIFCPLIEELEDSECAQLAFPSLYSPSQLWYKGGVSYKGLFILLRQGFNSKTSAMVITRNSSLLVFETLATGLIAILFTAGMNFRYSMQRNLCMDLVHLGAGPNTMINFLPATVTDNEYYQIQLMFVLELLVLGVRDPTLEVAAYQRGQCADELTTVPNTNSLFKLQVGYVVPFSFGNCCIVELIQVSMNTRRGSYKVLETQIVRTIMIACAYCATIVQTRETQSPVSSATISHHSLGHSLLLHDNLWMLWYATRMPWCGLIQNNIVHAESNLEQDASDSLFSSAMPNIFLNSDLLHISEVCLSSNFCLFDTTTMFWVVLYHTQRGRIFKTMAVILYYHLGVCGLCSSLLFCSMLLDTKGIFVILLWRVAWSIHILSCCILLLPSSCGRSMRPVQDTVAGSHLAVLLSDRLSGTISLGGYLNTSSRP